MKNKSELSLRELTKIIRNSTSLKEIENVVEYIRIKFDSYSLSDQSFLLALIGVTLMSLTADISNDHVRTMHVHQLLGGINWSKNKEAGV